MTAAPEVSVVMGVHDGAQYLRESIDSVLAQEGVELELIVVNDGSGDETRQILSEYETNDSRVRVVDQEHLGLTLALIHGCSTARGRYLARHDVGDYSLPARMKIQKAALDADAGIAFVSCWTEYYGPQREFLYHVKGSGVAAMPTRIISVNAKHGITDGPTHHGAVMFRLDAYLKCGGYRPQFYFGQDWDLWYRLGELGKFQMIEKMLYQARVMPNSVSGKNKAEQEAIATLSLDAMLRRRRGVSEDDLLRQAQTIRPNRRTSESTYLEAKGFYFIGEQLRRNGDNRAESYFRKSVATSPIFLKPWLRLLQLRLRNLG